MRAIFSESDRMFFVAENLMHMRSHLGEAHEILLYICRVAQ
jgi:hypothetical protein